MLEPFMPETSAEIARQLKTEARQLPKTYGAFLPADHVVGDAVPLFRKLEDDEIKEYRDKFAGAQPKEKKRFLEFIISDFTQGFSELEVFVTGKDESKVPLIEGKVTEQGDKVRKMKADKADKKQIDEAVTGNSHSCM